MELKRNWSVYIQEVSEEQLEEFFSICKERGCAFYKQGSAKELAKYYLQYGWKYIGINNCQSENYIQGLGDNHQNKANICLMSDVFKPIKTRLGNILN